ncbi:predicted protein [Nematostella vectensis]|uniref:Pectin acetylesterase n=1 Tax=Nematostella vectensis TaxID=45351 RepID=A7RLV4_NEMVE|nr:predicted protein [Nematostella vectensis]|eukprot:XP_001639461.1 predicted protein [Nematostella vectensis]
MEEEGFTRRSSRDVQLILLKSAVKQGAVCLDGSPPGYYYREGSGKGSDNWVLHFFGGAWCYDEEACLQRSKTVLGSSKYFPEHPPKLQGVLSGDARINPDFHDWNLVMICYCDGASFTGYRTEPVSIRGELIYMRGKRILEAIMDQLLSSQFSKAKRVLLTGTSAGGLSVVLHADYIRNKLPKSMALRAMSDSGYFVDIASLNGGNIINRHFKRMFEVHNSTAGVQQDCVRDAEPGYQWKCLFPQHTFRFLSTPIFILQSAYDAWQIIHVRGPHPSWAYRHIHGIYCKPPECTSRELKAIMQYRNITLHALHPVLRSRTSGLLLTSCMEHSQSLYDDTWTKLYVNGLPVSEIVGDWYFERSNGHHHVDCDYPCNPSCENIG